MQKWLLWLMAWWCVPAMAGDTITVTFTGDVLLDRGVREKISADGVESLFSPSVDSLFSASDVVVGNLECPVTHIHAPRQKKYIFRGEPEWLAALKQHGFTHLNMANNHTIDQGRRGLLDTRQRVMEAGMMPIGAGSSMEEAAQPVLLAETPRKVWMIASLRLALENYAYLPSHPCVSQESFDTLLQRVATLRHDDPRCYIIVSLHWGGENTMHPLLDQKVEAHRLIDAGADLLIGHHTHTLQDIEQYQGKHIFYSIGNFIFDLLKPQHAKACVVTARITTDDAQVSALPIEITDCTPRIVGRSLPADK